MDFSQIVLHPSFGSVHVRPGAQGFDGLSAILLLVQSLSIQITSTTPTLCPSASPLSCLCFHLSPLPFRPESRCWTPLVCDGSPLTIPSHTTPGKCDSEPGLVPTSNIGMLIPKSLAMTGITSALLRLKAHDASTPRIRNERSGPGGAPLRDVTA